MVFEHELSKVKLSACGERRQAKITPQGRRRGQAKGNATSVVKQCL